MIEKINHVRHDYALDSLSKTDLDPSPLVQFKTWMTQALESAVLEPIAATLATVDSDGYPSARIVLMREVTDHGFIFYTNYGSHKAVDLITNPKASLSFFWPELQRQVRIEGVAEKVSREKSQRYFAGRPRGSQIGAWASQQSKKLRDRAALIANFKMFEEKFADHETVPCPDFWGGFILTPISIEFWQGRESRLHDRLVYRLQDDKWEVSRLSP